MTVCFFGIYNPQYARNRVLIKSLKENGIEVILCNDESWRFLKYLKLFLKHWEIRKKYDILMVGHPGHFVMPLAKLISRKPIVFDAFVSLYDTYVFDRRSVKKKSLKALYYYFFDWFSCKLSDKILSDTNEHIRYFIKTFGVKEEKIKRIFVGSDESLFYPRNLEKKQGAFLVHFHGKYIPLQGVEYIVKAAKLLERDGVQFNMIGRGQTCSMAVNLSRKLNVENINFIIDFLPPKELIEYMVKADVCLGIFGHTPKCQRVIPNKVYEAIAMEKPLITADTPAIRELFSDYKDCLFCKIADEQDLAKKILELKNNPELRDSIAENGYRLYREKLTPKLLGIQLKKIIESL